MTRALITGGAGFIGSHLSERLLASGYQVTVIDNLSTGRLANIEHLAANPDFSYAVEDIRNIHVIDRLVSECDIIFHLAAAVGVRNIIDHPINTIEVNIGGTETILKTASRYRRRILIASTSEVYGKGVNFPFREDDDTLSGPTLRSRWSYAASKAIDEFLAFAYHAEIGLPITLFRLFQYRRPAPGRSIWHGRAALCTLGAGQRDHPGLRRRAAAALLRQCLRCRSGHPGTGGMREYHRRALQYRQRRRDQHSGPGQRVRDRADSASQIDLIPYEQAYQQPGFEDFRRRVPCVKKIGRAIGWQPSTPLDDTIDQIIAHFQAEMYSASA